MQGFIGDVMSVLKSITPCARKEYKRWKKLEQEHIVDSQKRSAIVHEVELVSMRQREYLHMTKCSQEICFSIFFQGGMKYPCFHLANRIVIRNDHFEDILDLFVKLLTIIDQMGCHKNLINHNTQEIKKIKEREHKDSDKIAELRKAVKTTETEMTKQQKKIPLLSKKVFD